MNRDLAIRMDGMLSSVLGNLDHVTHFMKNNLSPDEYEDYIKDVARAMGGMVEISMKLYNEHPDIIPQELKPPDS